MIIKEEAPFAKSSGPTMAVVLEDLAGSIMKAVAARSEQLINEADTMTLAKVRRLIEKDLNLEEKFLDSHKDIVKESIDQVMNTSKAESPKKQEVEKSHAEHDNDENVEIETLDNHKPKMKKLIKKSDSEAIKEEIVKDEIGDAGMSNMEEEGTRENDSHSDAKKEENMESLIRKAARRKLSYFKSQADSLTLQGVRRVLEEDLKMEKGSLDSHRQFVRTVLDELLNYEEEPVATTYTKKRKAADTESSQPKIKNVERGLKKHRATSMEEVEEMDASRDDSDEQEVGGEFHNSEEDTERKKPKKMVEPKPIYGKKVEHLKSIIKACGMTVPPNVYRRVKQAPEMRREAVLLKELETILQKEGLAANASKDEIKAARKKKEKLKDLEGIDTSNIIVESRGRRAAAASANNFFAQRRIEPFDLGDEDEDEEEQESESEDPDVEPQDDDEEDD